VTRPTDKSKEPRRNQEPDLPAPPVRAPKTPLTLEELRLLHRTGKQATVNADQVYGVTGCSRGLFYQGLREGSIPCLRLHHRYLIPIGRFLAWLGETDAAETRE
jgi:hypothetical protein